ncbi:Uncharacterised protein [Mycobacteroides abscessus subsp. abscessus]|nr:Uncharacterised protein [Mycobacteroides abscessus subsp. abscessus]
MHGDHLAVGEDQHDQQHRDRDGHRQGERDGADATGDEGQHDGLRAVGDGGQGVEGQRGEPANSGQFVRVVLEDAAQPRVGYTLRFGLGGRG